jgi:hypothetical protein
MCMRCRNSLGRRHRRILGPHVCHDPSPPCTDGTRLSPYSSMYLNCSFTPYSTTIIFEHLPASSVDAERSLSCRRLQVNHLRHGISSQSFTAKVAIGSWSRTPLLPPNIAEDIIGVRMKGNSKGKAKEADEGEREPEVMVIDYLRQHCPYYPRVTRSIRCLYPGLTRTQYQFTRVLSVQSRVPNPCGYTREAPGGYTHLRPHGPGPNPTIPHTHSTTMSTNKAKLEALLKLINSAAQEAIAEYEKAGGDVPSIDSTEPHPLDNDAIDNIALKSAIRTLEGACAQLCTTLAPPSHTAINVRFPFLILPILRSITYSSRMYTTSLVSVLLSARTSRISSWITPRVSMLTSSPRL